MKISVDTLLMNSWDKSYEEKYRCVAEAGYRYISLCDPKFPGFIKRPKALKRDVEYHMGLLKEYGLECASFVTGFPISSPDEYWRQMGVACWKRMFELAEDAGVKVLNTELGVGLDTPALCEEQLMRSLDELVPILQQKGLRMEIQAHPNDFYERHEDAYSIVRSYDDPKALGYLYAIPHSFYYDGGKGDVGRMLRDCAEHLTHVIFADSRNHTIPFRYNLNPPGTNARMHDHAGYAKGDVDWAACFDALRDIGFADNPDHIACVTLFGFPELFDQEAKEFRQVIQRELGGV